MTFSRIDCLRRSLSGGGDPTSPRSDVGQRRGSGEPARQQPGRLAKVLRALVSGSPSSRARPRLRGSEVRFGWVICAFPQQRGFLQPAHRRWRRAARRRPSQPCLALRHPPGTLALPGAPELLGLLHTPEAEPRDHSYRNRAGPGAEALAGPGLERSALRMRRSSTMTVGDMRVLRITRGRYPADGRGRSLPGGVLARHLSGA